MGSQPIIKALFATFPGVILEYDGLQSILENNQTSIFVSLLESQRIHPSALDLALQYAVEKEDRTMIEQLIKVGANPADEQVLKAATNASLPILMLILGAGPHRKRPSIPNHGRKALNAAIRKGKQGRKLVELLLQSDAIHPGLLPTRLARDYRVQTSSMGLAIRQCCEEQDNEIQVVRLFLEAGCSGDTALQLAAMSGNFAIAAELLDWGADLHQPPLKAGGRWPFEGAAEKGRLEMLEFLWKFSGKGFDPETCGFAMKVVERKGHLACRDFIRDLMEHGLPDSGGGSIFS